MRISELRQLGYKIVAERQKLPNGKPSGTFKYYLKESGVDQTSLL